MSRDPGEQAGLGKEKGSAACGRAGPRAAGRDPARVVALGEAIHLSRRTRERARRARCGLNEETPCPAASRGLGPSARARPVVVSDEGGRLILVPVVRAAAELHLGRRRPRARSVVADLLVAFLDRSRTARAAGATSGAQPAPARAATTPARRRSRAARAARPELGAAAGCPRRARGRHPGVLWKTNRWWSARRSSEIARPIAKPR
jgi:hypothetical protein